MCKNHGRKHTPQHLPMLVNAANPNRNAKLEPRPLKFYVRHGRCMWDKNLRGRQGHFFKRENLVGKKNCLHNWVLRMSKGVSKYDFFSLPHLANLPLLCRAVLRARRRIQGKDGSEQLLGRVHHNKLLFILTKFQVLICLSPPVVRGVLRKNHRPAR